MSEDGIVEQNNLFCANGASVVTYTIQLGEHQWYDEQQGFYELGQKKTLSELIWKFFEENSKKNNTN